MLVENKKTKPKDLIFVYTTCSDKREAQYLGLSAIENKLAIAADFWVINSIYPWKGVIQEVDQYTLMLSTQKFLADKLVEFIHENHSYTTPMIVEMETAGVNFPYKFWMDSLLANKERYLSKKEYKEKKIEEEEGVYHYGRLK